MPERDFTILYGSETGQSKAIAEEIHENCSTHGVEASIFCLSLTEKKFCINEEKCVVFVVSTTGDGEPPDTVRKFFRRLNKKTLPNNYLCDLKFGFLALGDSNYTNFCNCGKGIEKRILELGARPFYPTGYADDAVGLELVVDPWIGGLWAALQKHLGKNTQSVSIQSVFVDQQPPEKETLEFNKDPELHVVELDCMSEKTKETESVLSNLKMESVPSKESGTLQVANELWNKPCQELSGKALKIPLSPQPYLDLEFLTEMKIDLKHLPLHNNAPFQAAVSDVKMVNIIRAEQMTQDNAVKTALELEIDVQDLNTTYQPGDTFGIVCPNDDKAVDDLISRTRIQMDADVPVNLKVIENTKKRNATVPEYMPNPSTLRHLLKTCIDIKAVPKRALIRMLVDYTEDDEEQRRLQELCSTQGANDYMRYIREPYTGLMDILNAFPSCQPPIQRLLELLPRLQPRAYSVSSSPLQNKRTAKFVFNITVIKGLEGVTVDRTGLCTGWLEKLTSNIRCTNCNKCDSCSTVEFEDLGKQVQNLSIRKELKIPVYWRRGTNFKLPEDESVPIIMIGPGTGVAPFISFLSHREMKKKSDSSKQFGPMVLLYGCRHKERDFLYRKKIESFLEQKVLTRLFTSFSRDEIGNANAPKYVQDNLKLQKDSILPYITEQKGIVYICGDANNMARNVLETFTELFKEYFNFTQDEAVSYIKKLRENQRYLEDIWT